MFNFLTVGTKSLLFGSHQFIIHPFGVLIAFVKIHKRLPDLAEFFAIIVHDWGYWGCDGIDINGGEEHPIFGAIIAEKIFGVRGKMLVLGHSGAMAKKLGISTSTLFLPDKYYYVLVPSWLQMFLARLAGENIEYSKTEIGFNPIKFREVIISRHFTKF